jgi:leucyl aminopeptidase
MESLFEHYSAVASPTITQVTGSTDQKSWAGLDQLLLVLPKKVPGKVWQSLPEGPNLQALARKSRKGNVPTITTRLANKRHTAVCIGNVDASGEAFELLTFARKMVAAVKGEKAGTLGIQLAGFDESGEATLASYLVAAALAASFPLPTYRSKQPADVFKRVRLIGLSARLDLDRVLAEAEGNNIARWLTAHPPNKLDASGYAHFLKALATREGWQYKRHGVTELRKMGAGAFLAVAQGNADDSASIVRLSYRPGSKSPGPALGLVGKGIIFDTGGTNLKPFNSMLDMHIDMGGSAVAVGTLLTLTRLACDHPVDCWLAITENRTGPTAYKSQDVVTALNGKTIQTIHTDAEGRMALADTLTLASRERPALIIDYATLTGACMNAVTTRFSGVFTNRQRLHPILKRAGRHSGERVWPFPIGKEYLEELRSETADIRQCAVDAGGDHIFAASFLAEFIENQVPWIHVDLSACKRKGGLAHVPTDITGFGVRYSLNLLYDKAVMQAVAGD